MVEPEQKVSLLHAAVSLHKRSALQLPLAPKQVLKTQHGVGQQPCWRRPLSKSDQPYVRLDTLSIGWEFAADAWCVRILRDRVDAGPRLRRGHLTTPTLSTIRQSIRSGSGYGRRRSTTNLPETMLIDAKMNPVGPVTRQSYTIAHDAFVAWTRTHRFLLGEDHASLDRVLVRHMDEELFAKEESAAVARTTLFATMHCRGIPRHPQIVSLCRRVLRGFVRCDRGFSKDPLPLEAMVMLASDLLKQHRLLDKLAGIALVMSYDFFTRPSETLKIFSCDVITSKARPPLSVRHQRPERDGKRRNNSTTRERGEFDDTILLGFLASSSNSFGYSWQAAGSPEAHRLRTGCHGHD